MLGEGNIHLFGRWEDLRITGYHQTGDDQFCAVCEPRIDIHLVGQYKLEDVFGIRVNACNDGHFPKFVKQSPY